MNEFFTAAYWVDLNQAVVQWLQTNVLTLAALSQLFAIAVSVGIAALIAPPIRKRLLEWQPENSVTSYFQSLAHVIGRLGLPIFVLVFTASLIILASAMEMQYRLLIIVSNLLLAWVVIKFATGFVKNDFWRSVIAITAWTIAALNITGLLGATINILDAAAVTIGTIRLSALGIIKSILTLVVLLWAAIFASDLFERQIRTSKSFTPSIQVLLSKLVKIVAITVALLLALSSLGIDLTAFAVFSGAIGVGIGFGLQKIFSNLISGVILLLDKSIKPGDVIGVNDYFGRVSSLGARYVSVITRDGIEYLIPNEEIITRQVENWSYSSQVIRLKIPLGVHYQADVEKAIALCVEAANETERVLKDPAAVCILKGFGDSSVDLEIRFWINDPMNGRSNVISEILLKVWDKFHQNNIEIPYPQRDIHVRSVDRELSRFPVIKPENNRE